MCADLAKSVRYNFLQMAPPPYMGTINLLIFRHPSKAPCHLTHTSQPNHPAFQAPLFRYQTIRN